MSELTFEEREAKYRLEEERLKSAKDLTGRITDYVNTFDSSKGKNFCEAMSREHRTLQQSFTRLCAEWLEFAASDEYQTDGRNAGTKKFAQDIKSKMEFDLPLPNYLSFI